MVSIAFLRAPGHVVPDCSDSTGQTQGYPTTLRGMVSLGWERVEELGAQEGGTCALELDRGGSESQRLHSLT